MTEGNQREAAIDWNRVAASNSFAFLKATQGVPSKDGWFAREQVPGAWAALLSRR
ncbi:hypothetical protein [Streptomyces atratus]|uniref:hypothetical protein n=1 Tax=Streptomyces atratus TaxID=1893 RepID=UPI00224E2BCE|nr:hypothetical protein [Streptomyces atratus]MCX5339377.1 hypothetical protein [Streptomyces atratus]